MKKNNVFIINVLILLTISLAFFSCKKYPENKGINLNNPKKRLIFNKAVITMYKVNDIDSLSLLSLQFGQDISTIQWVWGDQYDSDMFGDATLRSGDGNMDFKDNYETLIVSYRPNYYYNPLPKLGYNIFSSEISYWKILKLYEKHNKTIIKLKREYNGKTYIIQFN